MVLTYQIYRPYCTNRRTSCVEGSIAPVSLFAFKDSGNGSVGETGTCLFLKQVF